MLSKNLKLLRNIFKVSQKEMAIYLGINRTTYQAYEDGRNNVPSEVLSRIAHFFSLPMEILLNEKLVGAGFGVVGNETQMRYHLENMPESFTQQASKPFLAHLKENADEIDRYHKRKLGFSNEDTNDTYHINQSDDNDKDHSTLYQTTGIAVQPDNNVQLLRQQIASLSAEVEQLTHDNIDLSRRYLEANKDFFQATKESLELSSELKTLLTKVKKYHTLLTGMGFVSNEDKTLVIEKFESIVLGNIKE